MGLPRELRDGPALPGPMRKIIGAHRAVQGKAWDRLYRRIFVASQDDKSGWIDNIAAALRMPAANMRIQTVCIGRYKCIQICWAAACRS